jgi:hypothetical protein
MSILTLDNTHNTDGLNFKLNVEKVWKGTGARRLPDVLAVVLDLTGRTTPSETFSSLETTPICSDSIIIYNEA